MSKDDGELATHLRKVLSLLRAPCFDPCPDGPERMHYFWDWDEEQVIRAAEAALADRDYDADLEAAMNRADGVVKYELVVRGCNATFSTTEGTGEDQD